MQPTLKNTTTKLENASEVALSSPGGGSRRRSLLQYQCPFGGAAAAAVPFYLKAGVVQFARYANLVVFHVPCCVLTTFTCALTYA